MTFKFSEIMKYRLFISLLGILWLTSCSKDVEESHADEVGHVVISANDFKNEFGSRTNLNIISEGTVFSWAEKDTVGIFPNDGAQVYFPMEEGAGTKTASFTGGGWALKNGFTYAAYYPFIGNYYLDKEKLPVDYIGQQQKGVASTAHLGFYDYMAAQPTSPSQGYVNFLFDHLGCLVQLRLTVPVAATFSSLSLNCDQSIFTTKAELGFIANNYTFTATEHAKHLDLSLSEVSSTEMGQELTFYMMLAPMDMIERNVYVTLVSEEGKMYKGKIVSKTLQAGYSYDFPVVLEETTDENLSAEDIKAPGMGETDIEI